MTELSLLLLSILPVLVIIAGLHDLTTMKIPNWISGLLVLGFVPAAVASGLSWTDIGIGFGVGFAALLAGMALFALRWVGGGDAKLLAAASLWFGLEGVAPFLLYTALIGGAFCMVLLAARARLQVFAMNGPTWVTRLMQPKGDIPYGVAIAVGALLAYPYSPLLQAFSAA